jgi:hypothetical protein
MPTDMIVEDHPRYAHLFAILQSEVVACIRVDYCVSLGKGHACR